MKKRDIVFIIPMIISAILLFLKEIGGINIHWIIVLLPIIIELILCLIFLFFEDKEEDKKDEE